MEPASADVPPDGWDTAGIEAATRTFAGPDDIPPNSVSAYGIVAFTSGVSPATRAR